MQGHKNHYQILGVDKKATTQQIKKLYKKLALKHHPDKNPDDKEGAKKRFTKIAEAYSVLSDADQRAAYDRELERPAFESFQAPPRSQHTRQPNFQNFEGFQGFQMPPSGQGQSTNFQNIFNQFRFNANQPQRDQPQQPQFKHFKFPEYKKPQTMDFGMFQQSIKPPKFSRLNSMGDTFGSRFTFEMAEEIFNSAFQEPRQIQGTQSSLHRANSTRDDHQPIKQYVPKNSTLLSQKKVEKNGKQVLVKKYSISDRDGGSHTETIETVLGKSSSMYEQSPQSFNSPPPPSQSSNHQQTNYGLKDINLTPQYNNQHLFKKKSSSQNPEFKRTQEGTKQMKKGGIATLQRLSSIRSKESK